VAAAIGDVQVSVFVQDHAGRAVRARVIGSDRGPTALVIACGIEHGYPVQPFVNDIDLVIAVDSHARSPNDLAVGVAVLAELADELFFFGLRPQLDDPYTSAVPNPVPRHITHALATAVQYEQFIVFAPG
jgi:hypothetical protein